MQVQALCAFLPSLDHCYSAQLGLRLPGGLGVAFRLVA
jgi:hypothetical protein